jgi:hypothetical protein
MYKYTVCVCVCVFVCKMQRFSVSVWLIWNEELPHVCYSYILSFCLLLCMLSKYMVTV